MAKIHLDWSDGSYSTRLLNDEEAAECEALGIVVAYLEDSVYDVYLRHCTQDHVWQSFWRAISNEQSMRRREKELMPLEDAQREIDRLKEDLARAKRMESFYEEQYRQNLTERHRERYVEFTCIYPQPGCDVDALPPKWRECARDILAYHYNVEHAAEGQLRQGCCCGNEHAKLDEATTQQLRAKGFLVEHDAEPA